MNQTRIHRCCHAYDKSDAAQEPLLLVDDRAIHEQIAQPNQQNYGETKAHPKGAKLTLTAKTLIDPMGQITSWHLRCDNAGVCTREELSLGAGCADAVSA